MCVEKLVDSSCNEIQLMDSGFRKSKCCKFGLEYKLFDFKMSLKFDESKWIHLYTNWSNVK